MLQAVLVFLFCYLFPRVGAAKTSQVSSVALHHDPIVNILLWVLYGLANTSFSFFFSTLFNDKYLAIIVPFFIIQVVPLTRSFSPTTLSRWMATAGRTLSSPA